MRSYLYIDQLAELTPWTPEAIRTMIARGVFVEGDHFFKPLGPRSRPIFKWAAVVSLVECQVEASASEDEDTIQFANGTTIDLDEGRKRISGLRD